MKKITKVFLLITLVVLTSVITYLSTISGILPTEASKNFAKYSQISSLENFVRKNYLYDVTDEQFTTGELKGVISGLNDPYSEYMTPDEFSKLEEMTTGKFYGIGVVITKGEDNLITVISPIKESPADKAGIKAGDKIIKVNGKEYSGDMINDATVVMKGDKGTAVTINVYRPSTNETKEVEIYRDEIKMETVISSNLDGIGYIGITQFDKITSDQFKEALNKLKSENIKGLVIDLRGNPGGIVDTSAEIADMLLPEGMIVYAQNKAHERVFEFKSDANQVDLPMAVLINKGSASASEILAGAMKDFNKATLIGEKSFGKGIVQTARRFSNGAGIKLTTSEYFTPSGKNIHKIGIEPDIKVDLPKDIKGIGVEHLDVDTQLQKAIEVVKNK